MQQDAEAHYAAGEYDHALAEFSVLREMRSRREGPYSVSYLANVHDCVRCMSALELWADSDPLCRELYGKYVHTHGRGEAATVDVAKHWAWALVHLADYAHALRLYLLTADALWETDPVAARRLLGAAAAHRNGATRRLCCRTNASTASRFATPERWGPRSPIWSRRPDRRTHIAGRRSRSTA